MAKDDRNDKAAERSAKQKDKERAAKVKEKAARDKAKEKAAKDKDKAARAKDKEKAAKAKNKERAAKAKAKEKAAKDKDKAARAKDKERAAKAKDKERAAKAKDKERAAKAKDKERAAKAKDGERAAKAKDTARTSRADATAAAAEVVQPVEDAAVAERGKASEVPAEAREPAAAPSAGSSTAPSNGSSSSPAVGRVPDNDKTVRPSGYIAEALGKQDQVSRSTQRATLAASYTTRDHDIIRAWAESRGGRPADVQGTGRRGAGVLRIQFPDGPGDDSRLEDIDWTSYFATFEDSNVDFLYQERVRTGDTSRFHKIVRAGA